MLGTTLNSFTLPHLSSVNSPHRSQRAFLCPLIGAFTKRSLWLAISKPPRKPPMQFDVIYADPAWTYDDAAHAGARGAGHKYSLMTDEDMQALPVATLAADDSVLLMWATFPKIQEALDLGRAWGFTYKTVAFTWVKQNRTWAALLDMFPRWDWHADESLVKAVKALTPQRWFMGMGRWTRSNAEVCLLFTRGKPQRFSAGVNQVVDDPRLEHSAKPLHVRDRIDELCGKLRRVELFARNCAPGWTCLGDELDGRDLRDSIPALTSTSLKTRNVIG